MLRLLSLALALVAGLIGVSLGAMAQEATPDTDPSEMIVVEVPLLNADGEEVGLATFAEAPGNQASIGVNVDGLEPGEHGIHIHETGICDPTGDQPFSSAGGHYNPTGTTHGAPSGAAGAVPMGTPEGLGTPGITSGHAGDLGNITATETGQARLQLSTDQFELMALNDADGSALVIHADPDDLMTDPSGNSGARVVCGVIFPPQDGATPDASPEA